MINKRRDFLIQTLIIAGTAFILYSFYINVIDHTQNDNIISGFKFLHEKAGFDVIMHLISFTPNSTYLSAFYVGVLNTLLLSFLSIIFATTIGLIIAISRLSRNWLISKLAYAYVEIFRNLPLLLQVFFWYFILLEHLPQVKQSYQITSFIALNIQGLSVYNLTMIPELMAMLMALSLYSASYISENIRAGIISINKGQIEAAKVCGLKPHLILWLIVLPQAAKVIIPPLVSQYLNIIKNSSLGSAIGYPDLVAVFAGTVLNQTGQALETIFMTMCFYLITSILVSFLINLYNKKRMVNSK